MGDLLRAAVAAGGVFAGTNVPLLGLIPIALGLRGLIGALRRPAGAADTPVVAGNAIAVAGVTIANGADNIAVYTPMFRTIGVSGSLAPAGPAAAPIP